MLMSETTYWIDVLRVLVSLSFLSVSSWYDYKFREVSNRMWILFAPAGFSLTFLQYYLEYVAGNSSSLILYWAISIILTTVISLSLFYAGFFGGADAKALICLSIAIPLYPKFSSMRINTLIPLFPIAVLVNSVFASSLLVLAILCHNVITYIQLRGEIFKGFENESCWKKILVFMTGVKVNLEKLKSGAHYIPLEYFVKKRNGEITRCLKVSPQIEEGNLEEFREFNGEIWATPGLPFLIFLTIGFIVALFFGDFTSWLVNSMFPF